MNTPESLNSMVSDLIRRGLPAEYAERAASEFADHHHDLVEELQATGVNESQAAIESFARLGSTRTFVKQTVREYQRRYWCGRWPLLTFLLGPIPLLVLAWAALWIVLFCIGTFLEQFGVVFTHEFDGQISTGERITEIGATSLLFFVMPTLTMYALVRLARRAALNWRWLVLSGCVLGLSVGLLRGEFPQPSSQAKLPDGTRVPADQHIIKLGDPVLSPSFRSAWKWYAQDSQQAGQVLLPLAIAAAAAWRAKQMSFHREQQYLGA